MNRTVRYGIEHPCFALEYEALSVRLRYDLPREGEPLRNRKAIALQKLQHIEVFCIGF